MINTISFITCGNIKSKFTNRIIAFWSNQFIFIILLNSSSFYLFIKNIFFAKNIYQFFILSNLFQEFKFDKNVFFCDRVRSKKFKIKSSQNITNCDLINEYQSRRVFSTNNDRIEEQHRLNQDYWGHRQKKTRQNKRDFTIFDEIFEHFKISPIRSYSKENSKRTNIFETKRDRNFNLRMNEWIELFKKWTRRRKAEKNNENTRIFEKIFETFKHQPIEENQEKDRWFENLFHRTKRGNLKMKWKKRWKVFDKVKKNDVETKIERKEVS